VSKGVSAWTGFDPGEPVLGAEGDKGDVLVVKSGTDFRDLSELELELTGTPEGSVRTKVISKISGRRIQTQPGSAKNERLGELLKGILTTVSKSLSAPVCKTVVPLDVRSQYIRTAEVCCTHNILVPKH
jgi:5'-nucleotidase